MTSGQTQGLPRRRSLNQLMESVAAQLAERPDHIAAAKVLEEMQEDASRLAEKSSPPDGGDAQSLPAELTLKMAMQNGHTECPPRIKDEQIQSDLQVSSPDIPERKKTKKARQSGRASTRKSAKQISLLPAEAPVHGANAVKLFQWLLEFGKGETIDLTLPLIEKTLGVDARTCRRILAAWVEKGVCEKEIHRRGMRLRILMDSQQAMGTTPKVTPAAPKPADTMEEALPELCPCLVSAGFSIKHLRRIRELLALQKIEEDALLNGLRYAEFELEHGQMRDSKGQIVSSPVDWVYRCLSKDGTYRIPKNYLSPSELHRREREEQIRRERQELEAEQRLREAEIALAFEKEREALFRQMQDAPEGELAKKILGQIPAFLRERGGMENPLVQKACLIQLGRMLEEASGDSAKTSGASGRTFCVAT